jgi:Histidine-specific methyltransferase, SAM-dependent
LTALEAWLTLSTYWGLIAMRVKLVDWPGKLAKLAELAGISNTTTGDHNELVRDVVFGFDPSFVRNETMAVDDMSKFLIPKSISGILANQKKKQVELTKKNDTPSSLSDWTNLVIKTINFRGDATAFYEAKFAEALWSELGQNAEHEGRVIGQPAHQNTDLAPIIYFDPKSHIGLPHVAWDDHGVVDQRYMYTDRQAAAQWAGIRGRETYGLYNICKTLAKSSINLIQLENPNIEQLILLGAGSPDKDWEIIFEIASTNKNNALDIFICDASFYMLMETKEELEKYIKINKAFVKEENIRIILSCFDFTIPQAWTSCSFDRRKITIIAILGGTIGNVSEAELFQSLKMNSKVNDYLIVAGSFYESSDDLLKNGKADIDKQYGNDAKALSLNSISDVLDSADQTLSFEDKIKLVDVTFEDAHDLYPKISSRIPSTHSAVFSIKTSSIRKKPDHLDRIERIFLLTSKRYVREEFCKYITSRRRMPLTLMGNFNAESSKFPFCHLVFRFSERLNDTNA